MGMNVKSFVFLGAMSAASAIGLGAFGAHTLKTYLDSRMFEVYQTAVLYHLVHSLGLIGVAFVCSLKPTAVMPSAAGGLMLAGMALFCGSLYLMSLTGTRWLGAITPFGGVALLAAWLTLAVAAIRSEQPPA